jgi:V8-like Glu-specific endopeptidase
LNSNLAPPYRLNYKLTIALQELTMIKQSILGLNLHTRALMLGAAVFAILPYALTAQAQNQPGEQVPVGYENPELRISLARDPGGHWTAENLSRAAPLTLPRPTVAKSQFMLAPAAQLTPAQSGVSLQKEGRVVPKESEVQPDHADRLFAPGMKAAVSTPAPASDEGIAPAAAGGGTLGGLYFSSSRLIPTDARLEYPYRAAGKLFFNQPGVGDFICSGAVIAPRLVLTAGHCVHKGSGGAAGYYQRFLFVPGYHQGQAPFQAWNFTWAITTESWMSGNGGVPNRADFAILELEDRRFGSTARTIGQVTGLLGYRTNALSTNHAKLIGYPASMDGGEVMHQVDAGGGRAADQSTVLYGSDMTGGSSGGPWVENFGIKAEGQTGGLNANPNHVVGVTSYGYVSADPKIQGSSILNQEFVTILNAACAHRAGNC